MLTEFVSAEKLLFWRLILHRLQNASEAKLRKLHCGQRIVEFGWFILGLKKTDFTEAELLLAVLKSIFHSYFGVNKFNKL